MEKYNLKREVADVVKGTRSVVQQCFYCERGARRFYLHMSAKLAGLNNYMASSLKSHIAVILPMT